MKPLTSATNAISRRYVVDMYLSPSQLQSFYAGNVNQVSSRDRRGVRVQFPLQSLRQFIGHEGVRGSFILSVDAQNRLLGIERATG